MKNLKISALILLMFLFVSCQGQNDNYNDKNGDDIENPIDPPDDPKDPNDPDDPKDPGNPDTKLPPVETNPPNVDYKPAFEGQTRIHGVKTETPYEAKVIANGLKSPWSIALLPNGKFVITERAGRLKIATSSGAVGKEIGGFPKVDDRNQGGLLDVVAAPDFEKSRMLYFTLAEYAEDTKKGSVTAVGKARLSNDETKIENFQIIFRALPYYDNSMHFGSRIVFDNKGNLFVSTGERSDLKTRPNAQTLNNGHGKVVYITTDGKPVEDNPFVNDNNAMPEIFSYGHRNVQGLAIHPQTGDLWASEMGPRGGDELNLIEKGKNYGWPTIGYGIEYDGAKVGGGLTQMDGMEQPVYYWDPVLSPSGMTFYSSSAIPEWQNNLFIGGLNSKHIARIVLKDNKVVGEERLLEKENQRIRDIEMGQDGALYAITDEGRLYRIGKK